MKECTLCRSKKLKEFQIIQEKQYWQCENCLVILLDPRHQLDPENELKHYHTHNNDPEDAGYKAHLSKLALPLLAKLEKNSQGLDFGCGPGPGMAQFFLAQGHRMESYDPFFFPNLDLLKQEYDFITCSETAEHFCSPYQEFQLLDKLLKPGGFLAVMTSLYEDSIDFAKWYYRRDPTHVTFYLEKSFQILAEKLHWIIDCRIGNVLIMKKL